MRSTAAWTAAIWVVWSVARETSPWQIWKSSSRPFGSSLRSFLRLWMAILRAGKCLGRLFGSGILAFAPKHERDYPIKEVNLCEAIHFHAAASQRQFLCCLHFRMGIASPINFQLNHGIKMKATFIILVLWFCLSIFVVLSAKASGRSFWLWFLISMCLDPIIGYLLLQASKGR